MRTPNMIATSIVLLCLAQAEEAEEDEDEFVSELSNLSLLATDFLCFASPPSLYFPRSIFS